MKKIFVAFMLLATCMVAKAQSTDHVSNIQLNLGGGMHTFLYDPVDGNHHNGFGGLFEAQYQLMFGHHFGIGIGAQISNLGSSSVYDFNYTTNGVYLPDCNGATIGDYPMNVTTTFNNWKERQRAFDLCAPIQLIFRGRLSETAAFQMGLGVTLDYIFGGKYKVVDGEYVRAAHCDRTNIDYTDLTNHTLGTYDYEGMNGDLDLAKFELGLLADLGVVFDLSERTGLYLGLYGNYGLNNINNATAAAEPLFAYANNQRVPAYNYQGCFASDRVQDVNPLEVGIKIGLRFGMCKEVGAKNNAAEEAALIAAAEAERLAAEQAAEAERLAAEQKAKDEALAKAKAEEAARAKAAKEAAERAAKEAAEKAANDAEAQAAQAAKDAEAYIANFKDIVYFETAKADPLEMNIHGPIWDALKIFMDKFGDVTVVVAGHTDSDGRASTNQALSERRANAVKAILVEKGIDAKRIKTVYKGENEPIATNATDEGKAKNRRVEITLAK